MITLAGGVYFAAEELAELADLLEAACRVTRASPYVDHIVRNLRRSADKLTPSQGKSAPDLSLRKYGVQYQPGSVQPVAHDDQLVDTSEAAALLGVTPAGVRYVAAKLEGRRVAGRWVFRRDVVMARAHQQAVRRAG